MLASGIKSRPRYPGLTPDIYSKHNIIVANADGVGAVAEMFQRTDSAFSRHSTIFLIGRPGSAVPNELKAATVWTFPTLATVNGRLSLVLARARMGTRLYVAGDEPLIGTVVKIAMKYGVNPKSIRTEHRGSTKRRVQCVHCKGITEDVTTNPVACAHCGTVLLVRDHYSWRIGAFMGVRVDAEVPGEIPRSVGEFK